MNLSTLQDLFLYIFALTVCKTCTLQSQKKQTNKQKKKQNKDLYPSTLSGNLN